MPALRNGCIDFDPTFKPAFTFVIVTKRHNKRFFAKGRYVVGSNPADVNKSLNLPMNSVIDKKVVLADVQEFYMLSHYPLKVC